MIFLFLIVIAGIFVFIGRRYFNYFFNPISIYVVVWTIMLLLYHLKFIRYFDLSEITWIVIISGFLSFVLGSITVFSARSISGKGQNDIDYRITRLDFLADGGKKLKIIIYITGVVGLLAALQNWYVLINQFGSIPAVFLAASDIYRMRVHSELTGVIPYFSSFSLVALTLSGIYTAYKDRLTIIVFIPFLGALLKSIASFARIDMLLAFVLFISSFLIYRHFLITHNFIKRSRKKTILISLIFILLLIFGASVVKVARGTFESYKGTSREFLKYRESILLSPSIYHYLSSHVGVLNKYLILDKERATFGANSLAPFYNLFDKFGWTERVSYHTRGYFIPMWSNSGTYLRELHADFGVFGITLVPYLIGMICSFFWIKFYSTGYIFHFSILVHLILIIAVSFFSTPTRGAGWFISLFTLISITLLFRDKPDNTKLKLNSSIQ